MLPPLLDIVAIAEREGYAAALAGAGGEYAITCPNQAAHDGGVDKHPSCRLNQVKQVFKCWACGVQGGVVDFAGLLGLTPNDVLACPDQAVKRSLQVIEQEWRIARIHNHPDCVSYLAGRKIHLPVGYGWGALRSGAQLGGRSAGTYPLAVQLVDARGRFLGIHARWIRPGAKRDCARWDVDDYRIAKPPLYIGEPGFAIMAQRQVWVEGITDYLTALAYPDLVGDGPVILGDMLGGIPGASAAGPIFRAQIAAGCVRKGTEVLLAVDNDEPGDALVRTVAELCAPVGARVRRLDIPRGMDLNDYVSAGRSWSDAPWLEVSPDFGGNAPIQEILGGGGEDDGGSVGGLATLEQAGVDAFLDGVLDEARATAEQRFEPVSTGVVSADLILNGGLYPGQNVIIPGCSGLGKTTFALGILRDHVLRGRPGLFFSYELTRAEVLARLVPMEHSQVSWLEALRGQALEESKETLSRFLGKPFYVFEARDAPTVTDIRRLIVSAVNKHGTPPLVVIDHLQLLMDYSDADDAVRASAASVSKDLMNIAKDTSAVMVSISAVSRSAYNVTDKRSGKLDWDRALGAAKESSSIESDAHVVLVLARVPEGDEEEGEASGAQRKLWLAIAKNRTGVDRVAVPVVFDGRRGVFTEIPGDDVPDRTRRSMTADELDDVIFGVVRQYQCFCVEHVAKRVKGAGRNRVWKRVKEMIDSRTLRRGDKGLLFVPEADEARLRVL